MPRKKEIEIVLDTETTGLDYTRERIIEFAAVRLENGKIKDEFQTLINPQQHIRKSSMAIHGITQEMVEDAPTEEEVLPNGETREVLRLKPFLAPKKVAVLPLVNKLNAEATKVFEMLSKEFACDYDTSGQIGKRYRRQDACGTPYCVTFDFDSLEDGSVTVRDRDTMSQERVKIDELVDYIAKKIKG